MVIIKISGLVFECKHQIEEGETRLESVFIDGQDISEIISPIWWDRIESRLVREVAAMHAQDALEAELNRLEAYCV